ncbi:hypothetical protein GQ54DRAFT_304047 [Martensiomyces pterosporus]|nr:hypothetical protein GQ54DRAFT_304047 [Martensiomyces pterosporus]
MAALANRSGRDELITMRFAALQRGRGPGAAFLDDPEVSDTSDDDDVGELARNSSNRMLRELGNDPNAGGRPQLNQQAPQEQAVSKPKSVKKAIAKHISETNSGGGVNGHAAANGSGMKNGVRKVTRVVKTRKHDSVMGEGLVASEELKPVGGLAEDGDVEEAADESDLDEPEESKSPMVGDIANLRRFIRDKSHHRDTIEPRDVPLREGSPGPRRLANYKPPLMGIDSSFVPPQLKSLNIDPNVWECFADALNAAIPRGSKEIENQIGRWNSDAFEDLGFHINLVSLDSGLTLSVSTQ